MRKYLYISMLNGNFLYCSRLVMKETTVIYLNDNPESDEMKRLWEIGKKPYDPPMPSFQKWGFREITGVIRD